MTAIGMGVVIWFAAKLRGAGPPPMTSFPNGAFSFPKNSLISCFSVLSRFLFWGNQFGCD
ncbi:MAG: hypothetical protein AAFZ52_10140, partial [Bacteroidota bacterium]